MDGFKGGLWVWTSETDLSWARSLPQRVEGLPPLLKLACGCNFFVAEAEESLWILGNHGNGQLAPHPTIVRAEERSKGPLRDLATLRNGVILIDSQGGVFSAGDNSDGQLGRLSGDISKLERIRNIPPMLSVACGCYHTLCLDENGDVWTWGWGGFGQLGTGDTSNQSQPTLVPSLKGTSALLAGGFHSLAFSQEGALLVFGLNSVGHLGLGHNTNQTTPTLSPFQPALPHAAGSKAKSARFL